MTKLSEVEDRRTTSVGFWLYLMTDCLLFATLFATYAVLKNNTAGSVSGTDIFDMNYVLAMSIVLLVSSVTSGFALVNARLNKYIATLVWLCLTIFLGIIFLVLELHEFSTLLAEGYSWQSSAFLSAFFILVGTHGLHIAIGTIWALVLLGAIGLKGLRARSMKQLSLFTMFWHFLDIIWIFIFTFVYAMGSLH